MKQIAAGLLVWLSVLPVYAAEIGGIEVPDQVMLAGHGEPLRFNGGGLRKKFFIRVYAAALYLDGPARDAQALLADPPANRVLMQFV